MIERIRPSLVALAVGFALAHPGAADAKPAKHRPKKPRIVAEPDLASSPSARYGSLTKDACLKELRQRGVKFVEVAEAAGVLAPVRLTGPLHGVTYRTDEPASRRAASPYEVFDCRLVLALDDFGAVLAPYQVEEAVIFSAWRPPPKSWPADKPATRHPGALAVDIRKLVRAKPSGAGARDPAPDLVVERDWTPARDVAPCPVPSDVRPATTAARELRSIYCEAASKRLFTTQLGPNYDKPHANHFHLEITPGVTWRMVL